MLAPRVCCGLAAGYRPRPGGQQGHSAPAPVAAPGHARRSGRSHPRCRPARSDGALGPGAVQVVDVQGRYLLGHGCCLPLPDLAGQRVQVQAAQTSGRADVPGRSGPALTATAGRPAVLRFDHCQCGSWMISWCRHRWGRALSAPGAAASRPDHPGLFNPSRPPPAKTAYAPAVNCPLGVAAAEDHRRALPRQPAQTGQLVRPRERGRREALAFRCDVSVGGFGHRQATSIIGRAGLPEDIAGPDAARWSLCAHYPGDLHSGAITRLAQGT